ncbi:MAG: DsbA family protein [Hyphomonadaceae bacterium]|nr:DsbA family protein [Hyphomonadaceae bacterium]
MFATRRTLLLTAAAAAFLAACQKADSAPSNSTDMTIGAADAPLHLIEYASATCPHCAEFHETVWPLLKQHYIDTGKVRFTFREMATPPAPVAVAMFQLARCGGADASTYLTRVGVLLQQQRNVLSGGTMQSVRDALVNIGRAANLSEEQVMACITDEAGAERVRRSAEEASERFGVTGTPTFILDGTRVDDPAVTTWDGMKRVLDAKLGAPGGAKG